MKYVKSNTGKAIKIMVWAMNRWQPIGQNWKIYKVMDMACEKYGITGKEAMGLQLDVLNGFIS